MAPDLERQDGKPVELHAGKPFTLVCDAGNATYVGDENSTGIDYMALPRTVRNLASVPLAANPTAVFGRF